MNVFVETCSKVLNEISAGKINFDVHLDGLKNSITKKIKTAEYIVVCGLTPIGKKCLAGIKRYTDSDVFVFDIRSDSSTPPPFEDYKCLTQDNLYSISGQGLFIICSREEAANYLSIIPKFKTDVISYNELMLLDKNFGIEGSLLHNSDFVIGATKSIFSNASIYLEILNAMSDVFSKEMLSRLILYRLYWDINLMLGLKSHKRPYFDAKIFKIAPEEVFVDIGGYNGDTLSDFYSYSGGKFKKYYFFEPSKDLLEVARQKYPDDQRIIWTNKGISDKSEILSFYATKSGTPGMLELSNVNDTESAMKIEVVALDDIPEIAPTFIKMDVEGAECNVLDGAEKTIRRFMPKMAVCIYHRPNDLVEIYQRLKNYGYTKFFLRAEEASLDYDIILYAQ